MHRVFSRRAKARRWLVRYPRAAPIAIFVLIVAVAAFASFSVERVERESEKVQLRERARAVASALERRANANASYLRAGAALFATLEDVPPARFRRFVSELRLDADYRGAEGIGWAQLVERGDIPAFERLVSGEYGANIQFHPQLSPSQAYAIPVTFLEPDTERNRRALGYDMYSEPVRRAAMGEAERTARPTASGKVVLVQEGGGTAPGFLIYMPVFDTSSDTVQLSGFIYSAFNAEDFLASALQIASAEEVGIALYDETVAEEGLMVRMQAEALDGTSLREEVMVANHRWILEVTGARGAALSPLSIAILLSGLLLAAMLALFARMLTGQAREDGARLSWFEEQNSIRDLLTRELNHRVKNTLANVLSIVALTRRRASTVDEFAEGLDGRIRALSATHDLLTRSEWGTTPVRDVIEAELAPYSRDCGPVITLDGPHIELAPNDALSLGLAVHELATNAAKYGALSQPGGKLSIVWSLIEEGLAQVEWTESEGPPVPAERSRGFGMDLIEKIVAHELQHPIVVQFDSGGVSCTLLVPVREPRPFVIRQSG